MCPGPGVSKQGSDRDEKMPTWESNQDEEVQDVDVGGGGGGENLKDAVGEEDLEDFDVTDKDMENVDMTDEDLEDKEMSCCLHTKRA